MTTPLSVLARRLAGRRSRLPPLLLLTDERIPDPRPLVRRLPPGCGVVLRHYESPERAELACDLARLCRARRLVFLVAADASLAAAVRADGLHLPEGLARTAARPLAWLRRRGGLLTVAAHSPAALRRAARLGADAALLSPVFPTASHPESRPLGPRRFAALARSSPLPVYALGGVNARRMRLLAGSGAAGVATVGGL